MKQEKYFPKMKRENFHIRKVSFEYEEGLWYFRGSTVGYDDLLYNKVNVFTTFLRKLDKKYAKSY